MSLATRISILAACAVGISVAVASLAAYVTLRSQLHNQLDKALLQRAHLASHNSNVVNGTLGRDPARLLVSAADVHLYVITPDGRIVSNSPASAITPLSPDELKVARGDLDHAFRNVTIDEVDYRCATVH